MFAGVAFFMGFGIGTALVSVIWKYALFDPMHRKYERQRRANIDRAKTLLSRRVELERRTTVRVVRKAEP